MEQRYGRLAPWAALPSLFLCLGLLCGAAGAEELAGKGEWRSASSKAIRGEWAVTLAREGEAVRGNLDLTGSNVFSGGTVSGTLDETGITFGVMADGANAATFTGKLEDGAVEGEWSVDAERVRDHGVWSGSLQPSARR